MINLNMKKQQPFMPVVTAIHKNKNDDALTNAQWKGFKLNDTYELRYKIKSNGREMSLKKFTGWDMMRHVTDAMNYAMTERKEFLDSQGINVDYWMRKASQRLLSLYASALLDKKRFIETSRHMDKDDLDLILVKRSLKNNAKGREALRIILSNASVYFYCMTQAERHGSTDRPVRSDESKVFSCITVEDCYDDAFPEDYDFKFNNEDQKRQLFAINGWKSDEEFKRFVKKEGILEFKYEEIE